MSEDTDFDMQAAWLRHFSGDAEADLRAFALRMREAMPELVTVRESRRLFSRSVRITGVSVALGDSHYNLELAGGQLRATIGMVVRGIALNTRDVEPSDWFARLSRETQKATVHAKALSRLLASFMER